MKLLQNNARRNSLCYRVRAAMGMSQRAFAAEIGVSQTTIHSWETGGNLAPTSRKVLLLLARAHGVPVAK